MNVLLVEDDRLVRKLLRRALESDGHVVYEVSSLREVQAHTATVEVIVLDLTLEDSHGTGTVSQVAGMKPSIPIVVVTGSTDIERIQGAVAVIHKGRADTGASMVQAVREAPITRAWNKMVGKAETPDHDRALKCVNKISTDDALEIVRDVRKRRG